MTRSRLAAVLALAGALAVAACGATAPSPSLGETAPPPSSAEPSSAAPASPGAEETLPPAMIVTLEVAGGERYKVRLTGPDDKAIARDGFAGNDIPSIPNGRIVRGDPGVNEGWSWHIDPDDFEWADAATAVCDGLPSAVEDGTLSGDRFCPWSAKIVDVQPAD